MGHTTNILDISLYIKRGYNITQAFFFETIIKEYVEKDANFYNTNMIKNNYQRRIFKWINISCVSVIYSFIVIYAKLLSIQKRIFIIDATLQTVGDNNSVPDKETNTVY